MRLAILAVLIALPCATLPALSSAERSPDTADEPAVYARIRGVWDWAGERACRDNPHTISFEDGGATMALTHRRPLSPETDSGRTVYRYKVLGVGRDRVRGLMEDEHRMHRGKPVVWELVLFERDVYRWRMTHSAPNMFTREVVRCRDATAATPTPGNRTL